MEDFAVTCQLVPSVPHLRFGSCTSSRAFGLGFLQTPPRDDALALLLAFGSSFTWLRDFHPDSSVPCPAHTLDMSGRHRLAGGCPLNGRVGRHFATNHPINVRARERTATRRVSSAT